MIDTCFIKPLDEKLVLQVLGSHKKIVTVEDNVIAGGLGSAVLEFSSQHNMTGSVIFPIGLPDRFIEHGTIAELKKKYGLDKESLLSKYKDIFVSAKGKQKNEKNSHNGH